MTREEAKKAAEVMLAYAEGKKIEFKTKEQQSPWREITEPIFDWTYGDYRIKKEPTYRPFKDKEECWAEMQKHKPFGWVQGKYSGMYENLSAVSYEKVFRVDSGETFETVYDEVTFADGTPFGMKEE